MVTYADKEFYMKNYLQGRKAAINAAEFAYWSTQASQKIREHTFCRLDNVEELPAEVKMCCCEIAEKLYIFDTAKGENGMVLQSYGNDGETGTFKTSDMSESAVNKSICNIVNKWLSNTGLLYCGVRK